MAFRARKRGGAYRAGMIGATWEWQSQDKRKALELIEEERAEARAPGFAEGLEFERFLDHPQNEKLLKALAPVGSVRRPAEQAGSRPAGLGVQANILWLYYTDLAAAQRYYEEHYGLSRVVDQGFARVMSSSASGFIGPVDESQWLHRFAETKAVTVSFLSDEIDRWFARLTARGMKMRPPLQVEGRVPVRTFVTYDLGTTSSSIDSSNTNRQGRC